MKIKKLEEILTSGKTMTNEEIDSEVAVKIMRWSKADNGLFAKVAGQKATIKFSPTTDRNDMAKAEKRMRDMGLTLTYSSAVGHVASEHFKSSKNDKFNRSITKEIEEHGFDEREVSFLLLSYCISVYDPKMKCLSMLYAVDKKWRKHNLN